MKILLFTICLFSFSGVVKGAELTNYSTSAIMIEPTTNKILYDKNKDERLAPASMTKMMTMLLIMEALDENKIELTDMVNVSKNAASMGGSQVFIEEGTQLEVLQLLKGIAIASGNDAAVAMAEHIAGNVDTFVEMMNNKVKELGLKNTNFVNVHGLDANNHYSSAYDMSQIARELIKYEDILNYTSLYEDYLIKPDGSKTWLVNTNRLVRFYDGVDGLKTGYTSTAKYCLTATASRNNIRFITVVMGVDTSEHRSLDTTTLLNYGFANYQLNTILTEEDIVTEIDVKKGKVSKGTLSPLQDVTDLVKKGEEKNYSFHIDKKIVAAPVNKGEVVGSLEVVDDSGKVVRIVDLVINETIEKHSFWSLFVKNFKDIINGYL